MSNDSDSNERKRKKGVRHQQDYKRNQIKKAKLSGEGHTNWKGRYVPCRNDPEFINLNCCHNECLKKINPREALDDILISFYAMGTKDEQDIHLQRGELKEKFMISKYHEFKFSAEAPHSVVAKEFIDGFRSATFDLRKTNINSITLPLQKKYTGPVPIAKKKMIDLKKLKQYIPADHIPYWETIYSWPIE